MATELFKRTLTGLGFTTATLIVFLLLHHFPVQDFPVGAWLILGAFLIPPTFIALWEWKELRIAFFSEFEWFVIGAIYLFGSSAIIAYFMAYEPWIALWLMSVPVAADTGAYFAGKKYGKTQIFPVTSPKKTYEGAVGGAISAFAISFLFYWFGKVSIFELLATVAIFPASVAGDYFFSYLKRASGKKDAGSSLPGHGGFVDRFDSHFLSNWTYFILIGVSKLTALVTYWLW
ncbi:MAG: phosphatidate cytidylyltransferase [Alphaproteobacteria bacterium]|nr:phosphatidate cytidylyltransferase [Alphaproteobacteria bacterium]MDD9920583.1 phosphatidate cytidylyltransferase [Alphaproteobacteria bacterium]